MRTIKQLVSFLKSLFFSNEPEDLEDMKTLVTIGDVVDILWKRLEAGEAPISAIHNMVKNLRESNMGITSIQALLDQGMHEQYSKEKQTRIAANDALVDFSKQLEIVTKERDQYYGSMGVLERELREKDWEVNRAQSERDSMERKWNDLNEAFAAVVKNARDYEQQAKNRESLLEDIIESNETTICTLMTLFERSTLQTPVMKLERLDVGLKKFTTKDGIMHVICNSAMKEAEDFVRNGKKINAIKVVRERAIPSVDLMGAKEWVETKLIDKNGNLTPEPVNNHVFDVDSE